MIWEFKQNLYASQKHVSLRSVADLSNPAIRERLQAHVDQQGNLPAHGAPDEYAALFEAVWPSEIDRQTFIRAKVSGAKPAFGYVALATLMRAGRARIIWTTNFDSLTADACAKVYERTGALTTVSLDAPALAQPAIASEQWPIEVKLHGDFRSRRLSNTPKELLQQDAEFRQALIEACQSNGLVIAGYSGRDASIMEALRSAVRGRKSFPHGLFWLHRGDGPPLPEVETLLRECRSQGIEAGLVGIDNFDETMRDLVRLVDGIDTTVLDQFALQRTIWTAPARLTGSKSYPVVRLNALQVVNIPTVCRKVVCDIGGTAEVREAVAAAGVDILVARSKAGVLAFGSDADVRKALKGFKLDEFDLHAIETKRLRYDSHERGLLREALSRAISNEIGLDLVRRSRADMLSPRIVTDERWKPLQKLVGVLQGFVPDHPELGWREGVSLRMEWADDKLWLAFEPRTVFVGMTDDNRPAATDFARERTVRRYNRQLNSLFDFWSAALANNGGSLRALGIGDGVDAVFSLGTVTAFSRRVRA